MPRRRGGWRCYPQIEHGAALGRAHAKPGCFYGADELCPGMSFNNDDEPIENCKQCGWCSAGYFQLEAEAMVRENGEHLNQTKS